MFFATFRKSFKNTYRKFGGALLVLLAIASLFLLAWEFGFRKQGETFPVDLKRIVTTVDYVIFALFSLNVLLALFFSESFFNHLRGHVLRYLLFIALAAAFLAGSMRMPGDAWFIVLKCFLAVAGISGLFYWLISKVRFNAPLSLVISFLLIICIGSGFLLLPRATVPGENISFVNAFFTATSATCVTGLIVQDTGSFFSPFGQTVILVLLQIGGLGLMTFVAFFALTVGSGMYIREQVMMSDMLKTSALGRVGRVVVFIFSFTFFMEIVGAAVFFFTIPFDKLEAAYHTTYGLGERVFMSVFHAVSAFCNAGFSLWPDSFTHMHGAFPFNLCAWLLIIIGGLGFAVNMNLMQSRKFFGRLLHIGKRKDRKPFRFELHTKLVLLMTAFLLLLGFVATLLIEYNGPAFTGMTAGEKATAAMFHSTTARTAGFNTVNTSSLSESTQFLTCILMYVGASPGGTGGGIKTSTFFLCILAIFSLFRRRENVEAFRRTIPGSVVSNTLVILVTSIFLVALSTFLLSVTQGHNFTFMEELFEVTSAFGTVGLTLGITGALTTAGKVIIVATMFLGRIGPLTLVLAMAYQSPRKDYEYPSGSIMIG